MKIASACAIFCIKFYQCVFSPLLGRGKCRFYPTCSEYAVEALRRYGLLIGLRLSAARLLKCGPWHEGGYDPVPDIDNLRNCRCAKKFQNY